MALALSATWTAWPCWRICQLALSWRQSVYSTAGVHFLVSMLFCAVETAEALLLALMPVYMHRKGQGVCPRKITMTVYEINCAPAGESIHFSTSRPSRRVASACA